MGTDYDNAIEASQVKSQIILIILVELQYYAKMLLLYPYLAIILVNNMLYFEHLIE